MLPCFVLLRSFFSIEPSTVRILEGRAGGPYSSPFEGLPVPAALSFLHCCACYSFEGENKSIFFTPPRSPCTQLVWCACVHSRVFLPLHRVRGVASGYTGAFGRGHPRKHHHQQSTREACRQHQRNAPPRAVVVFGCNNNPSYFSPL